MSTAKPRIAAYLPQHLFDTFEQFRIDRGLSTSSATALILASYFELNLTDVNESVLTRLVKLEQQMLQVQAKQQSASRRKQSTGSKPSAEDLDREAGFVQIDLFGDSEPN
jgi:hypothetical protein